VATFPCLDDDWFTECDELPDVRYGATAGTEFSISVLELKFTKTVYRHNVFKV